MGAGMREKTSGLLAGYRTDERRRGQPIYELTHRDNTWDSPECEVRYRLLTVI
jgi:hypothetical protein